MIENVNLFNAPLHSFRENEELLSGITKPNDFLRTEPPTNSDFFVDEKVDVSSFHQFEDAVNVEDNPIIREVFNNIKAEHNIDLAKDPVVIDTLKALLYL